MPAKPLIFRSRFYTVSIHKRLFSTASQRNHNPRVGGSSPSSATSEFRYLTVSLLASPSALVLATNLQQLPSGPCRSEAKEPSVASSLTRQQGSYIAIWLCKVLTLI